MTNSREAAFHQAGHAVATHLSRFHILAQGLKIDAYGSGEMTAALSRRKLMGADKIADAAARADPEVAVSIAVILCAGLVSEQIAAAKDPTLKPDPTRSAADSAAMRQELRGAGLPEDAEPHETNATLLLTAHWHRVEAIAEALLAASELQPFEITELLGPDS